MNPDLEKLVQLQRAESELHRVESDLAEVPKASSMANSRVRSSTDINMVLKIVNRLKKMMMP